MSGSNDGKTKVHVVSYRFCSTSRAGCDGIYSSYIMVMHAVVIFGVFWDHFFVSVWLDLPEAEEKRWPRKSMPDREV